MSFEKMKKFFGSLAVVTLLLVGLSGAVNADSAEMQYKRKKCADRTYDSHSIDEERTTGDCSGTVPTPEPVSILLFTAGLAGIGFAARRRLRKSEEGN